LHNFDAISSFYDLLLSRTHTGQRWQLIAAVQTGQAESDHTHRCLCAHDRRILILVIWRQQCCERQSSANQMEGNSRIPMLTANIAMTIRLLRRRNSVSDSSIINKPTGLHHKNI
jgi:hypothetical protein